MNSDPVKEHDIIYEIARGVELSNREDSEGLGPARGAANLSEER